MLARLLVVMTLVALAGCAEPPPARQPGPAWQELALPAGVRPASLAVAGEDVLVGGSAPGGPAPRLLRVRGGAVTGELRLDPDDPTAEAADLVSLTVAGDDVYAIGGMISGAHSNLRVTVWDGTLDKARLTSRPQEFATFGGHDAGPLLGTVEVGGRPVIFGSRAGAPGPYGLLWTRRGHTWRQQEPVPALASSPDRVLGFSALATIGKRLVVVGDELGLAGPLNQQPVLFLGSVGGDWQESALPVPREIAPAPGQVSRASSVACAAGADTCWVSGWVRGHALAWPVSVPATGPATAGRPTSLPGDPPPGNGPTALVTLAGNRPAVLTNASAPTLQIGCPDGWRNLAAPGGTAIALVAARDALYAVAAERLWRYPFRSC